MACRQDGSTVLIAHANDLRAEVGVQAQLVANGRSQQVAGRHLALLPVVRTNHVHRCVLRAVRLATVNVEVVATNTVKSGRRASIGRRMANGRYRR